MLGGAGAGGFKNIQVLLSANNSNLKSVLAQSATSVDMFQKKVDQSNKGLATKSNALKVGLAGGAMAAGAGLMYAAAQAAEFDKAMRNVNSLAGLSETALGQLQDRVIGMSTRLPQSAVLLAEGLYDITSSGFSGADAMKVLEAAALSASAGLTTTEISAKAIAAVLNAYGLQAGDAADVSDVLFQTVNAGVISFEELAGGLGNVVGGTAAAKVGIDQVGSAIATMTLAGIGGAEATTSLNALMQKIVQPSKAFAQLLGEMGYESGAAALEADGLRGVMDKVREATGGNITTMLQLFPEIRAARGALALMANEGKNYTRVAEQIEDKTGRAGATQSVFNEQMKAASNQLTLFKNQVDAAAIEVGTALLPYLLEGMDLMRQFGGAVKDGASELSDVFGPGLEDLGRILGDLWDIFGDLGMAIWDVVEPLAKLGVGAVAVGFNALMAVLEPMTDLLAENEGLVIVLATALGVALAGGAARAATQLGYLAVLGLVQAISGLMALQSAATRAAAALVAMAPGLALVAAIGSVVVAWQSYTKAADAVDEANKAVQKSFADFDLAAAARETERLVALEDELVSRREDQAKLTGPVDFFDDWLRFDKNFRQTALLDGEVELKAEEAKNQLDNMRGAAMQLWAAMEDPSQKQMTQFMEDMSGANGIEEQVEAFEQLDSIVSKFGPKLKDLGVDLSDGIDASEWKIINDVLSDLDGNAVSAADAQANLVDKLGEVETAMGNTEEAADNLSDALDALMGAAMGADEAGIKWRAGLADLRKTLIENEGALLGNSAAAGENRLAVQDQVELLQDQLVAMARNGAGADKLSKTLLNGRDALIAQGVAAKIPKKEMEALLNQYRLTPELVETLIREHGGKDVKKLLKDVKEEASALEGLHPTIRVIAHNEDALKAFIETEKQKKLLGLPVNTELLADARQALKALRDTKKAAEDVDSQSPTVDTSAPGAAATAAQLWDAYAAAQNLDGKSATVTTYFKRVNIGGPQPAADGGVFTPLPSQAKIQAPMGQGLYQWAEAETGGEAFIPLAEAKRGRSTQILGQVAEEFGYALTKMANGGKKGGKGKGKGNHGSFAAPASPAGNADERLAVLQAEQRVKDLQRDLAKSGKGALKGRQRQLAQAELAAARVALRRAQDAVGQAKRDRADAREDAQRQRDEEEAAAAEERARAEQEARENAWRVEQTGRETARLQGVASGQSGAGRFVATRDAGSSLSAYTQAMQAQAQAQAELAAQASENPFDSAEDFYKEPTLSLRDYGAALKATMDVSKEWGRDVTAVAEGTGHDVVAALQGMGEEGQAIIEKLADASVEEMRAMAQQIRAIQFEAFSQDLAQDVGAQQQFQANLMTLVGMGRADLAAQFQEMGYKEAGGLAAHAVTLSPAELAALAGQMDLQDKLGDPRMAEAIKLAGALQSSPRPLGLVGLSQATGTSLADVVGLLETYRGQVFSKLPPAALSQILADQQLVAGGGQPSGLEHGGIVTGSKASRGLYYRWAEPGSGGESLIPHAPDRRARALELWEATGRIIGARGGAGGGTMVIVAPGAVSVSVDAAGQNLSAAQLETIANRAADSAMEGLAQKIRTGAR